MLRAKQKTVSILVAFLTLLAALILGVSSLFSLPQTTASAAEATETMSIFGSTGVKTSDSSSISWTGEHFTFTNNKASSTTAIRTSDSDHYRVYKSSTCTLSSKNGELISEVVITSTGSSYVSGCSPTSGTKTTSGSTITITFTEAVTEVSINSTAQWRLKTIVITYTEASNDCTHVNLSWVYDSATKEHYQQCDDCETEIENTRAACSEFTYGEYTTVDGVHTQTATCIVCGGEQEQSGDCEVSAEYVREGNQHTQTGTCTICGKTTTVTEDCTLSYNNVSNDNGTHNTTSTCSVCNISATTENVDCTFDETLDGTTLTYTCKYCGYSYEETATTYTVTYEVPNGIAAVESAAVAEGYTTVLPTAGTTEGYTFVGWTDSGYEANTTAPANIYEVGSEYEVTADVILYALYTYTEGEAAESWELVTATSQLAVGKEIVIAASGSNFALSTTQNSNNRAAVEITKSGDTITLTTAVQEITLEKGTIDGTWAFNVGNGYLYAASSSSNYLRTQTTNDANGSWAISVTDEGVATITAQGSYTRNQLKKNSSSALFSCYGSGQADVSIYVKTGGQTVFYTTSFDTVCEHTDTRVETVEATCMAAGVERTICNVCGATTGEVELPKLDHDY
ncbi:MAG: InlB B-repeat-containing protein, partial [Clostridia bacterium]|nr:InlB B-repeat-containing protein [Clostridia bacterium]